MLRIVRESYLTNRVPWRGEGKVERVRRRTQNRLWKIDWGCLNCVGYDSLFGCFYKCF